MVFKQCLFIKALNSQHLSSQLIRDAQNDKYIMWWVGKHHIFNERQTDRQTETDTEREKGGQKDRQTE